MEKHVIFAWAVIASVAFADWPTFNQNNQRNAKTTETLNANRLSESWTWSSHFPPDTAWSGPAKWDAYAGLRDLKSMRNYDPVFHVIAVNDKVWFGSSADHHVYCLDASTGKKQWTFATEGPVRIAPTFSQDKLYFGSDDGFAYCLGAGDGRQIWKTTTRVCDRKIINNGKFISQWPIRSGVAVEDGTAYFTASLLPWQESYLCAVDANTGKHDQGGQYLNRIDYVTMEGPLAISPGRLIVIPQGRVAPQLFSLMTGTKLGSLGGGGGSFVILTPDSIVHGPGNKTGWLTSTNLKSKEKIASFKNANAMVVADHVSFTLTDQSITATDLQQKKQLWTSATDCNLAMILVGQTLFAGGVDTVSAIDAKTGELIRQWRVDGRAYGLAAAAGRLFVSTDVGKIHAFAATAVSTTSEPIVADAESSNDQVEDLDGLEPILKSVDKSVLSRWVFQRPHVASRKVDNLASGGVAGTIEGRLRLERVGPFQAIQLDGQSTQLPITRELDKSQLPKEKFTVEAWARVDQPLDWGGFVGCIQDNGAYERGWILGFANKTKLSFAVCGKDGPGRLTYLNSSADFTPGGWHHVVGTYDGRQMMLYVDGTLVATSDEQKGPINYPPNAIYELGAYHDDNENYQLTGMLHEVGVYDRVLSADDISARYAKKAAKFPKPEAIPNASNYRQLLVGPWLRFDSPSSAVVRWQTDSPTSSTVKFQDSDGTHRVITKELPSTSHDIRIEGLKPKRLHRFQIDSVIDGKNALTQPFECDLLFNYEVRNDYPNAEEFFGNNRKSISAAEQVLQQTTRRNGICVVLGCGDGSFIYELAKRSAFKFIAFDQDIDRAERVRNEMLSTGLYGGRVTIHIVDSLQKLAVTGRIANLVVSGSILSGDETQIAFEEAARILAPTGKALFTQLSDSSDWIPSDPVGFKRRTINENIWAVFESPKIEGSGSWTHIYGAANNTHYGGESLARATKSIHLALQWIGRPGPRYQADRNGRKTPPLSTGGKIFLQGLDRLIAMDQYNGTILWSLEIPGFRRFNIPRDCGNWCADENSVYAAIRDRCWRLSTDDGKIEHQIQLPNDEGTHDWGFVARTHELLIGSAVKQGNIWLDFWGQQGWYDGTSGQVAAKVCSDRLFALNAESLKSMWDYKHGLIINSTICMQNDTIYFVESRNSSAVQAETRRLEGEEFWKDIYLVALDAGSGEVRWQRQLDITKGDVAFYAACKGERLVLVASSDRRYFIYGYNAVDGSVAWHKSIPWGKGKADHGSHLSRPAIVGNQLFVRPGVFDLTTGQQSKLMIPVGGCGTYAATDSALFFRAGSGKNSAMWNTQRGDYTMWNRLRPDCWLSTIPAGGMLLSPEGGGGCSCGNWMETSVGFIPKVTLENK